MWNRTCGWITLHPARTAALAGWAHVTLNVLANAIMVPLILNGFGKELAGVWFFLISGVAFFQLCDFGLSQGAARQIAFSTSDPGAGVSVEGSKFIRMHGRDAACEVFRATRGMYRMVALAVLAVGTIAERTVLFSGAMAADAEVRLTWYLIVLASVGYVLARPYQACLEGLQLPSWERVSALLAGLVAYVLLIISLMAKAPMPVVGAMFSLGGWAQYAFSRLLLAQRLNPPRDPYVRPEPAVARAVWSLSWEQGIATTAAYFIFSVNPILVGYFLGAAKVPDYYLPWKIANVLLTALFGLFVPQLAFMIRMLGEGHVQQLVVKFFRLLAVTTICTLTTFAVYGLAGPWAIRVWSSGRVEVDVSVVWVLAIYHALAVLQTLCAIFVTAHGMQPFAAVALTGALVNLGLAAIWIPRWGVLGCALATALAQLVTSNWFVPYMCLKLIRKHSAALAGAGSLRRLVAIALEPAFGRVTASRSAP